MRGHKGHTPYLERRGRRMKAVALIPARGGSKRLPRKNLLPFRGKPMIASTVDAAVRSGVFEIVMVSTDDDELAVAGEEAGAQILRRPDRLGEDDVPLLEVAKHALHALGPGPDALCMLMPNCPLRTSEDIVSAHQRFAARSDGAAVMSVFGYGWSPPQWALRPVDGYLARTCSSDGEPGRQELVCPSGAIRWVLRARFLEHPTWYPERLVGHLMPWWRALDIDDQSGYEASLCIAHALDHGFRFQEAA